MGFVESTTDKVFLIDGISDQGFGYPIVYAHVTKKNMGSVEITLLTDFQLLLVDDFQLIGREPAAIRYTRRIMNDREKVPVRLQHRVVHMSDVCRR